MRAENINSPDSQRGENQIISKGVAILSCGEKGCELENSQSVDLKRAFHFREKAWL